MEVLQLAIHAGNILASNPAIGDDVKSATGAYVRTYMKKDLKHANGVTDAKFGIMLLLREIIITEGTRTTVHALCEH